MNDVNMVFTEKYNGIAGRLLTKIQIKYGNSILDAIALWDTGATGCCISKECAKVLALPIVEIKKIHTPSGESLAKVYRADLIINKEVIFNKMMLTEAELKMQGIDVLIGMDVIHCGDFAISNFNGKTQFSFRLPSQENIEFIK